MLEFGSWEDATSRTSKMPTTTKWVDRAKRDDTEKTFVRCRLVARDFKPKREGPRDDLFAAMPPLEAKKALFAFVAGVREKRRVQGHDEVTLMFVNMEKAHLNAKCDEEEWVELPDDFQKNWEVRQVEEMAFRDEKGGVGMGGRLCKKTGEKTGFNEAVQHQRYSTIPRRRCESSCTVTTSRCRHRVDEN